MDQFNEWDRFMELLEESRTYERAWKRYRKERKNMQQADDAKELRKLERDLARDAAESNGSTEKSV